uniref:Uncharacterized protein n=1 Tax=Arundo donax TaxID=35708 RepID=A0A0A9C9Z0_ARUDO
MDPQVWVEREKVKEDDNIRLSQPFYEEEVKRAVFEMEKNTAPGSNHIPIEFYQKC